MNIKFLNDKEKLEAQIIGFLIKEKREKRNITASKIAIDLGISRQYISEIEHGNRKISFATIENILQYLQINFVFIYREELLEQFYVFLQYFYVREIEKAKQQLQTMIGNCTNCYDFDYPIIMLSNYILSILHHKKYELSSEFIVYLRKELYTPFLYFKAYEHYIDKEYDKSLKYIEQAITYIRHLNSSIKFIAIIYYLKALVFDAKCYYIGVIQYNQMAKKEFIKDYNIQYVLYSTLHVANAYANLGIFSKSIQLYEEILEKSKMLQDHKMIKMVKYNVCMLYFLNCRYDEILTFFKQHMIRDKEPYIGEEYLSFNEDIKVILSKVYYEVGDKKRSLSYFKRIIVENIKDQFMKNFVEIHRHQLIGDMKSYEEALHNCLREITQKDVIHAKIFVLKHLMKYYDDTKDYEKAYKYAKMIFELTEKIRN